MRGSCGALTLVRTGEPTALGDSCGSFCEYLTRPHANGVFTTAQTSDKDPPPAMSVLRVAVSPLVTHGKTSGTKVASFLMHSGGWQPRELGARLPC